MTQTTPPIHEMKGTQFPFGVLNVGLPQAKKVLIKKKYLFKDEQQYENLRVKIDKLKNISHKNTINLRSTEQNYNSITLFYQYVPYSLEDSFHQNPTQTIKDLHRQFIELAIYLAKHCIVTSFNPRRCGVVFNENCSTIKYYLPLSDISITDNRTTLERSVQLLNLQSMSYLDNLINQTMNTTLNQNCSQRTFKNRVKLFPQKLRKDSQPNSMFRQHQTKFTNNPNPTKIRKLSTLSRELSQMSLVHKRNRTSTSISGGSYNTFHSIVSFRSQLDSNLTKKSEEYADDQSSDLKRCMSVHGMQILQVENVIKRSKRALQNLQKIKKAMQSFKQIFVVLKKLHSQ